ncbi:MAG: hypothetical protein OXQ94_01740 [Gemmatimonadota bacterium]|nr:hypothetical protein [Gemmatimonadota bacterium]MDE2870402.1 hypothetical protein [Gemmatimonadota bacterium]
MKGLPRLPGAHGLLGLLAAAAAPVGLGAQGTVHQNVEDRRIEYRAAKEQHEAAFTEAQRLQHEWDRLLERYTAARQGGDEALVSELLAEFQERSGEKDSAETGWRTSRERWVAAADALISAIDARLTLLVNEIEVSVGSAEGAWILYGNLEDELELVEGEVEAAREPLELEPMPEIEIGPDDTPREIRYKATVIENTVARYDLLLQDLDREIESLVKRQEREQKRRDILAARERFSHVVTPTGTERRSAPGATGVTDSTAVNLALEPIEARIEKKRALRKEVADRMEETRRKAEEFRQRAGGRS